MTTEIHSYDDMPEDYKEICRQGRGLTWHNYMVWKEENKEFLRPNRTCSMEIKNEN